MATTVTSRTAAWAATGTATSTTTTTITIAVSATPARTSFTPTFGTRAGFNRCHYSIDAIEVWLIIRIEIRAPFDHRGRRSLRRTMRY